MGMGDRDEGLFDALLDAWLDYVQADHVAGLMYHVERDMTAGDTLYHARLMFKEAFDAYLDARETATRTALNRYVTENGCCRVCAGTGDTPKGDPCKFCDGYGRPA